MIGPNRPIDHRNIIMNNLQTLLAAVYDQPDRLVFTEVLAAIDTEFDFTATAFSNGELRNSALENQGSCRVLSFAPSN